jgi:uncharacterized protein
LAVRESRPPGPGPSGPTVAASYSGHDPALLERLLPRADYVEVTPDTLALVHEEGVRLHPDAVGEFRDLGPDASVIAHGVGLSIGSYEGYNEDYLRVLDLFMDQVPVAWHSEHLGYTRVGGEFLGTMLAVPKTEEALEMVAERITAVQERYGLPFLVENVVHLLPDYEGDYSEAGFLNALSEATGCGLLLDVYNLQCDAANHGFDIAGFLDELALDRVVEVHVAGGVKHRGFTLDVHSRPMLDSTLELARRLVARAPNVRVVTYELLQEAVPALGHDRIAGELDRLSGALATVSPTG